MDDPLHRTLIVVNFQFLIKIDGLIDTLEKTYDKAVSLDTLGPVEVSPNVADVPVAGEGERPLKRTYKVVRRVYTRGPYRGRQTIRQQILKVLNTD